MQIQELKDNLNSKGWVRFDSLCEELANENKRFSNKEVEESALKIMRNAKDKKDYFLK